MTILFGPCKKAVKKFFFMAMPLRYSFDLKYKQFRQPLLDREGRRLNGTAIKKRTFFCSFPKTGPGNIFFSWA